MFFIEICNIVVTNYCIVIEAMNLEPWHVKPEIFLILINIMRYYLYLVVVKCAKDPLKAPQ